MIKWQGSFTVHASADAAFDVIGTNVTLNHPKWENEVQSIRQITPGPVGVGTRAVMVRKEMGRLHESEYEVTEFVPGRSIAFVHPQDALGFTLRFALSPLTGDTCQLTVEVAAEPKGALRLMQPMMRLAFPSRSRRITEAMVAVIETTASEQPAHQLKETR
ncbi:MAG: SRPBCC family protein [Mycobacteriales bacterium]